MKERMDLFTFSVPWIELMVCCQMYAIASTAGLMYIIYWLLSNRKKINASGKVVLITGANSGLGKGINNSVNQTRVVHWGIMNVLPSHIDEIIGTKYLNSL